MQNIATPAPGAWDHFYESPSLVKSKSQGFRVPCPSSVAGNHLLCPANREDG